MGADIRFATSEDSRALAAIARVPVELEGASVTIDRGDDFMAPFRLAEDSTVVVADVDGQPVGVYSGALHPAIVDGEERQMLGLHQCRLHPDHQRSGLFPEMAGRLMGSYRDRYDAAHTFIHPDNATARRLTVVDPWSVRALRAVLPCAALAGSPAGRSATPDDAEQIAGMLNALHGLEEMYLPFTAASFAARVTRAPDLYGWDDIVVGDGAMVGMWTLGESRRWHPVKGEPRHSRRAWVLDYGCDSGADGELERLLRDRCRVAAERGMSHLTVFTSETSPSRALLEALAEDFEPYDFRTAFLPEPVNAAVHGLHVDPIYF